MKSHLQVGTWPYQIPKWRLKKIFRCSSRLSSFSQLRLPIYWSDIRRWHFRRVLRFHGAFGACDHLPERRLSNASTLPFLRGFKMWLLMLLVFRIWKSWKWDENRIQGIFGRLASWVLSHSFRWLDPSHPFVTPHSVPAPPPFLRQWRDQWPIWCALLVMRCMQWLSHPKNDGFRKNWWQVSWKELWNQGSFWMCLDQPDLSAAWSAIPWFFAFSVMKKSLTHFLLHPKKWNGHRSFPFSSGPKSWTRGGWCCLSFPTPPSASDCHQVAALWVWSTAVRA